MLKTDLYIAIKSEDSDVQSSVVGIVSAFVLCDFVRQL